MLFRSSVRIWNTATGEMGRILEGHSDWVTSVAFSPDGSRVVSGSRENSVRIWNAITEEIERVLEGHSYGVTSVAFSPDGTRVVSGSEDKSVQIWSAITGELERVLEGHSRPVWSVAFSPDGTCVVSGSEDASVHIWDLITHELTSLSNSESFQLPDGSIVLHHLSPGVFQLFSPNDQEAYSFLTDRRNKASWVSPELRDIRATAFSGSKVCLGCTSGRIVIVDFNPEY